MSVIEGHKMHIVVTCILSVYIEINYLLVSPALCNLSR